MIRYGGDNLDGVSALRTYYIQLMEAAEDTGNM